MNMLRPKAFGMDTLAIKNSGIVMAAMLIGRGFLPERLSHHLPKVYVSWIRMLSSDNGDNGEKPKTSVEPSHSDLLGRHKGKSEIAGLVEQAVKDESENEIRNQGEEKEAKESSFLEVLLPKLLQTGKAPRKRKNRNENKQVKEGNIPASGILSFMTEYPQQYTGYESLKVLEERSSENVTELRKSLMRHKMKAQFPTRKGERPQWMEKSLEDFEKARTKHSTAQAQTTDPKLNQKIKQILAGLQVGTQKSGSAEKLVTAVEYWGKTINRRKRLIQEEYLQQTVQTLSETPSWMSFDESDKTGLFDDILKEVKHRQEHQVSESEFLFHLTVRNRFQNRDSGGLLRNAFSDQMKVSNRLWTYPVDNEVCNSQEEQNTSFEEHVFLEYLLDDFPSKGPVRRFMELVINGLQKNPFLSVAQKKERVGWFRDYFANFSEEELNF